MVREPQIDIYDQPKHLDYWMKRLEDDSSIPAANKDVAKEFLRKQRIQNLRIDTIVKKMQKVFELSRLLGNKEWRKLSRQDIEALVEAITLNDKWTDGGKEMRLEILRNFLYWLGYDKDLVQKNTKIKNDASNKLPEELLTEQEIHLLMNAATLPRDRALIAVLADSGARISELARMRVKNVAWEADGAVINIPSGKTGQRRVRLMWSMHALKQWIAHHPKANAADFMDAPLWTDKKARPMAYGNISQRLWRISKNAGVTKATNPHAFRHYHATQLAKLGLNEAQMCARLGWRLGSKMPRVYLHLSGADTDAALYRAFGVEKEGVKQPAPLKKPLCPRCCKENSLGDQFCRDCGMPLDLKAMVTREESVGKFLEKVAPLMDLLQKNPELLALLKQKAVSGQ